MKRTITWAIILTVLGGGAFVSIRPQPTRVELGRPEPRTVHEYIAEEAKKRHEHDFLD